MADLSTVYMGLRLKNPLVVASCSLTKSVAGIQRCAEAGAAAVVLKSLFEEQITAETQQVAEHADPSWHTEAADYVRQMGMEIGPRDYLQLIEGAKAAVDIPVIASLNCHSTRWWADYAKQLETAGADALELNISYVPTDPQTGAEQVEGAVVQILERVRERVSIPIAVKLGPQYSSLPALADRLARAGAAALVLFNRYYQIDIDPDQATLVAGNPLSTPAEAHLPLRWVALLSGRVKVDLAATTGVHDADGAVKMLLAGATVVQVCSVLYQRGVAHLGVLREGLEHWMALRGHQRLDDFRGRLRQLSSANPDLYQRLQYIQLFVGIE